MGLAWVHSSLRSAGGLAGAGYSKTAILMSLGTTGTARMVGPLSICFPSSRMLVRLLYRVVSSSILRQQEQK